MTVIDIHTHMLTLDWIEMLRRHGAPRYSVRATTAGQDAVHLDGAPFMTLFPGMWDYDLRIRKMDEARVDMAIVSLTCPNVYWGDGETSLRAARLVNDDMAEKQARWPDRIGWLASLPWQHADLALAELERATAAGAVGVMVLANIAGRPLIEPAFAPIWEAIDRRGLPVLVHPTAPPGVAEMGMDRYGLVAAIGFMCDTTLAVAHAILDGFLDRYPSLHLIAGHGGATLPYLAGRLDVCHERIPQARDRISERPSAYLQRIYYDTVVYRQDALELLLAVAGSPDRLLYGSDYPHNIGDMAGCLARVEALPAAARARIAGKNAQGIFRL